MSALARPAPPQLVTRGMLAHEQVIVTGEAVASLLPGGSLRRGSLVFVHGSGGVTSLVLAILAHPLANGSWAAVLGMPALGIEAASAMGVPLEHMVLIPNLGRSWADVVAVAIDAMDIVVLQLPQQCNLGVARRLAARARQRGSVVIVVGGTPSAGRNGGAGSWPEPSDFTLDVQPLRWSGIGNGWGTLCSREVEVRTSGRRVPRGEQIAKVRLPIC